MSNDPARQVWVMAASLVATAVLSFAIGVMATLWTYSATRVAAGPARAPAPQAAAPVSPGTLRLALAPATPVSGAEAAVLVPEVFADWAAASRPVEVSSGLTQAHTVHLGLYLRPDLAEEARHHATARGLAPTIRLTVDGRGRAWYVVEAGEFPDRIAAELAARALLDDVPVAIAVPRRLPVHAWSRG